MSGKAVARVTEDATVSERRERITQMVKDAPPGQLPEPVKQEIEKVRMVHRVAREIANLTWGRELNQNAALAIAVWADRNHIDITEFDVLGGRLYKNASFYLNRAAPLIRSGVIAYLRADHIHADARLVALAKDADASIAGHASKEIARRTVERITHNVPEGAVAAVVARCGVRIASGQVVEYTGCKWVERGKRKDPVGEAMPAETCETRAYRRVLRMVAPTIPSLATAIAVADDDGVGVEEIVSQEKASDREQAATLRPLAHTQGDASWTDNDTYTGEPRPTEVDRVPMQPVEELPLDDRRPFRSAIQD